MQSCLYKLVLIQTVKAVHGYTFDNWSNKFVIKFTGEEGKK